MSDNNWTPIACPECDSHRYAITQDQPPKAKCADCGTLYDIPTLPPSSSPAKGKKTRTAAPGKRHRRPNGPQELEIQPVPAPRQSDLGAGHLYTYDVLQGGPKALIAAHHQAAKLSQKFGEEFEAEWCLSTKWLQELTVTSRARAQYALMWRPRLLAVVALTRSVMLGCRAAKVAYNTVKAHRRADVDFDRQIIAAQEHAVELLHDVTMRDAIEGTCEPVLWQGIPVCWVRKYDNRLRVEMLRAHMPDRFKTPGAKVSVNTGNTTNVLVVDEATRDALVELRQQALHAIAAGRVQHVALIPEPAVSLVDEAATTR
jgi:hypothetical protein